MRILIIDQCSAKKAVPSSFDKHYDEKDIDSNSLQELREQQEIPTRRAGHLYQGLQQNCISEAVDTLRQVGDSVERVFISAGFGVVDEDTSLPAYNVTFADKTAGEIQSRSEELGIQTDIRRRLETTPPFDIVFFTLGKDYYQCLDLGDLLESLHESTLGVVFNQEEVAIGFKNVISISARLGEAKDSNTTVLALKGRYLQNFADHRSNGAIVEDPSDVVDYCTTDYTTQVEFGAYDG